MSGRAPATAATLLLALLAGGLAAPQNGNSTPVAQLLSDAAAQAGVLRSDIGTLDFFASSASGWQSHASVIQSYREHIGAMRNQAARLDAARKDASRGEKTAIERIVPLLEEFAASADAAIAALDRNPAGLNNGDYKEYLRLNSDLAGEFTGLISTWVSYGKTRDDLGRVAQRIGAPAQLARY